MFQVLAKRLAERGAYHWEVVMLERSGLLLTIAIVFCTTAIADDQITMRGVGTSSCAEFRIHYRKNPKLADLVYGEWAQGFMSGLNAQLLSEGKPARNIPAADNGQIRQLCDQLPSATYFHVVRGYFATLPELPPQTTDHK